MTRIILTDKERGADRPDPRCTEDIDYTELLYRLRRWVIAGEYGGLRGGEPTLLHFWGGYIDTWRALEGVAPPIPERDWRQGGLL